MGISQGGAAPSNGSFGGIAPPPFQTSRYYQPHYLGSDSGALTLTANRMYTCWFYVPATTTFLGGWFYNSGTTDNGKNVRVGVYNAAGSLKMDFGATALTNASALRSAANSVTLSGPAWYRLALVSDSTPALYSMELWGNQSAVGLYSSAPAIAFGWFSGDIAGGGYMGNTTPLGEYAAFTYGALPSTMTTMTNTIKSSAITPSAVFPRMGLYL